MSKKKPVSRADKLKRTMDYLYEKREPFMLKDLGACSEQCRSVSKIMHEVNIPFRLPCFFWYLYFFVVLSVFIYFDYQKKTCQSQKASFPRFAF